MAFHIFKLNWSSARKKKFKKWLLITIFTVAGPLIIIFFKTPGSNPDRPPILTIASDADIPLPLTINVNANFETTGQVDLYPLGRQKWSSINMSFSPEISDIEITHYASRKIILKPGPNYLFKKYPQGSSQLFIKKDTLETLLIKRFSSDIYSSSITFKLTDVMMNHSFSNKSLVMFYLSMAGKDSIAKHRSVNINLETPFDLVLNSSVPSPERILVLNKRLNYDFRISASDSGLLFNFTDSRHEMFEEITMFIVSSVFGFFSGMLIEHLLKNKVF